MRTCHDGLCGLAGEEDYWIPRRSFVKLVSLAAGTGLLAGYLPRVALAGDAQALMLSCMDYRFVDPMAAFMNGKGLDGKYDHVVLAGASLGVVSKKFAAWHDTFWQHLDVAIQLHRVHEVVVIDHLDCGAYKLAFGDNIVASKDVEMPAHSKTIRSFAALVRKHHPDLAIEGYVMALDGTAEQVTL